MCVGGGGGGGEGGGGGGGGGGSALHDGSGGGGDEIIRLKTTFSHIHMVVMVTPVAPPMKRLKLKAKPVSKNWSMEKQGWCPFRSPS